MDLELLHTFLEVSKTRHFGKAAEKLFITQSAVSARIRSLEENLNTRLFERSTKLVTLTEEGEKFVTHAEAILLAWANAKLDVISKIEDNELLSIGSTAGLWHFIFNRKIAGSDKSDDLLLNLVSFSTDQLTQLLYNHALDIILTYDNINEYSIQHMLLGTLNLRLCMHKSHVQEYRPDITPYIHVDWGASFNPFIAKHFGEQLPLMMQTDNAQTAQFLLKSTKAAAYLPEIIAQQQNDIAVITGKKIPSFKRKVYACYHSDSDKKHHIKKLVKDLQF